MSYQMAEQAERYEVCNQVIDMIVDIRTRKNR